MDPIQILLTADLCFFELTLFSPLIKNPERSDPQLFMNQEEEKGSKKRDLLLSDIVASL